MGAALESPLDRSNIGLAKLVITEDLHFNESIYGLGAGLFYLGYSLFDPRTPLPGDVSY